MAMRLLSQEEFNKYLHNAGFENTGEYSSTGNTCIWKTPDGEAITITVMDRYPDFLLDRYLEQAGRLYIPLYDSNIVE